MSSNLFGIYRATVLSDIDPTGSQRLQVLVPALGDDAVCWAAACVPGADFQMPEVGDTVWIIFEAGDIHLPVWVGVLPKPGS